MHWTKPSRQNVRTTEQSRSVRLKRARINALVTAYANESDLWTPKRCKNIDTFHLFLFPPAKFWRVLLRTGTERRRAGDIAECPSFRYVKPAKCYGIKHDKLNFRFDTFWSHKSRMPRSRRTFYGAARFSPTHSVSSDALKFKCKNSKRTRAILPFHWSALQRKLLPVFRRRFARVVLPRGSPSLTRPPFHITFLTLCALLHDPLRA